MNEQGCRRGGGAEPSDGLKIRMEDFHRLGEAPESEGEFSNLPPEGNDILLSAQQLPPARRIAASTIAISVHSSLAVSSGCLQSSSRKAASL